jgi:hypothetical protein
MVSSARYRCRHDVAREAQGFAHAYPAELGNPEAFAIDPELVVGKSKTVVNALAPERRIASAPGEEILEGASQLDDRHLWRAFGYIQHPRELISLNTVELAPQHCLVWPERCRVGPPRGVLAPPLGQRPVVGKTCGSRSTRKVGALALIRGKPNAVCH